MLAHCALVTAGNDILLVVMREGPGIRSGGWVECTVVVVVVIQGTHNSMSFSSALVLTGGGVTLLQG